MEHGKLHFLLDKINDHFVMNSAKFRRKLILYPLNAQKTLLGRAVAGVKKDARAFLHVIRLGRRSPKFRKKYALY